MSNDAAASGIESWLLGYVAKQAQPDELEAWTGRVTDRILADFPEVSAPTRGADLGEEIRIAVRDHWVAFLGDFAQSEQHFHLVTSAADLAEEIAIRQLPLEMLLRIYRAAQQEVWTYVAGLVEDMPEDLAPAMDRAGLLIYFWGRAGAWLDASMSASSEIYQAARTRALAGAAAQRFEAASAVLDGQVTDARQASASLGGYPITVHHTALVLSVADPERAGTLEALANEIARKVGAPNPLLVKPGGRQLWMWLGTRDAPDLTDLATALVDVRHESAGVGIGSPTPGLAGFVASHREALRALEVSTEDRWLVKYTDVELPVLLGCSPEVDRFVERVLGGLAANDESTQRIRETLIAFLARGGSAEETSRDLMVHRNTIRYRLGQAEELLGHPVARINATLSIALEHHELFHAGPSD